MSDIPKTPIACKCEDRCADALHWRMNSRGLSQLLDKAIERLKHARKQRDDARAEAMRLRGELELAMKINRQIARPNATYPDPSVEAPPVRTVGENW